ncbi:MAG: hypothetical protein AB7N54_13050 [Alphaproteobacteria bacterium]
MPSRKSPRRAGVAPMRAGAFLASNRAGMPASFRADIAATDPVGTLLVDEGLARLNAVVPIPDYKEKVFSARPENRTAVEDFARARARVLPDLPAATDRAFREIHHWEGGNSIGWWKPEGRPRQQVVRGIMEDTVREYGPRVGIPAGKLPSSLSHGQAALIYAAYFDDLLRTVGKYNGGVPGHRTIGDIGDADVAAAFADALFREGRRRGAGFIQQAANDAARSVGRQGWLIGVDEGMGPATFDAVARVAQHPQARRAFLDRLAELRKIYWTGKANEEGEIARAHHFAFGGGPSR